MRIKKKNTNEYLLTEDGVWVRNLCKQDSLPIDINNSFLKDYNLLLENEFRNKKNKLQNLEISSYIENFIIISDGYNFLERHKLLSQFPFKEIAILAVNGALANWGLVGKNCPRELLRPINWYIVNNPYPECKKFLPVKHNYYPPCIASSRTNYEFASLYRGGTVVYYPVINEDYCGLTNSADFLIDDYRNPICAAIGLAYKMGAKKILLFCCDGSFESERPASQQLENGLWCYPQHLISQNIIDAILFWLKKVNISVADCSNGKKLENATYITSDKITEFFKNNE